MNNNFGDISVFAKDDVEKAKAELLKTIPEENVEKVEVIGKYVNVYFKDEYLIAKAEKTNYEIEFRNELAKLNEGKIVVIDYSGPNIAKPFGIGHLRSTNIGQALYNVYKILGWNCIGDNHLGDFGTQFGKLIVAIKKWAKKDLEKMTVEDLEELYVKFHSEEEKDEKLIDEARDWFLKLEKGDNEAREIWKKCVDISLVEFDNIYRLLEVHIDNTLGESFYEDKMASVIKEMTDKGLTKESKGAVIVEFDDKTVEIVKKSNETTTYFDRDMATVKYRIDTWKPDLMIYEVGADQSLYFRHLFETVDKMGWMKKDQFYHVAHGLIRWKEGKFSTRHGNTIHLKEVIDKMLELAKKIAPENDENTIKEIAIGALKFNDLSLDPKKDIIFDWEKIMSLEGDSGPYLQYTYARGKSVIEKSKILENKNIEHSIGMDEAEKKVMRELIKFDEKIIESAKRFNVGILAEYLLGVARLYNEFYNNNRIIENERENVRLFLTQCVMSTIKMGLGLLGIKTVDKM